MTLVRRAARLLVVDDDGRALLFEEHDPSDPETRTWWITPGGGLEPGEDHASAAHRELLEETGLDAELLGPVHEHRFEMTYRGRRTIQIERFFVARVPVSEIDTGGWSDFERAVLKRSRWWSVAELQRSKATVYPPNLAVLLLRVVRTDPIQ